MQSNTRMFATASPIVATFTGPAINHTHTRTSCTIEPTAKTTASVTGIVQPEMIAGHYYDPYVQINVSVPLPASCSQTWCAEPIASSFFVRRTEPDERWRRTFEEIVLIFSDQQLLTGFGVLIAGYVQVVNANLSAYHWNNVVYLAWVSSTVHLMSLSVLRERLKRSKASLMVRLCAILLVFVLLIAALWPMAMFPEDPAMPVRCLWKVGGASNSDVGNYVNTSVSYLTLVGTFVWKLSQFSDRTRGWIRYRGMASWECALEKAARRLLQAKNPTIWTKTRHRLLTTFYIVLVAHLELLDSFMFTITVLTYTLVWGTLHLVIRGKNAHGYKVTSNELDEAEKEMGFGQILALLLLAQPALAALDTLKRQRRLPVLTGTTLPTSVYQYHPIAESHTLSKVLASSHVRLLTAAEKATGDLRDPVIDHLYRSRTFKGFIVVSQLSLAVGLAILLMTGGAITGMAVMFYLIIGLSLMSDRLSRRTDAPGHLGCITAMKYECYEKDLGFKLDPGNAKELSGTRTLLERLSQKRRLRDRMGWTSGGEKLLAQGNL
ncbi:uncharacterized protein PG998_008819 [Apiospora kogelbergensis]|uniref:uncharacterized protein n=1 Tax=Apiospora kogelbergensis TaxID=1337665 RepID=UPI00313113A4